MPIPARSLFHRARRKKSSTPALLTALLAFTQTDLSQRAQTATTITPAPLQLRPQEFIQLNNTNLDVGNYAIPAVVDWNGDRYKDLLVGYRPDDKIALFLNIGTNSPVLTYGGVLKAAGRDIVIPGGSGCGAPAPYACDFDADGDNDLIVGSGADGYFLLFKNIGTSLAPQLAPGIRLVDLNGEYLTVGSRAAPCFIDWNGDGAPDLLGGSGDGSVFFFKNIGSKTSPIFAPGIRLSTDSGQLNFGSRAVPRVHDWNEDGLLDLLVSSSTGVYWCQNAGSQTSPRLTYPRQLTAPGPTGELSSINTSNRMRLEVSDWNQDGTADLLIGNTDGTLCLFQGYRFAITSFTWSSDGTIVIQWNSAPKVKYSIVTGPTPSSCKDPVASAIPSGGTTTSWQNRFLSRQQFFQIRMP